MLRNLPYRARVPLGLALAVVITALLVTAVAAQVAARTSKLETLATVNGAIALLRAQARPLLAEEDTWRLYVLLRDTSLILPGHTEGLARAAILDTQGRIVASSDPSALETGRAVFHAQGLDKRLTVERDDESVALVDPISSEDGLVLGYSYVEVDGPVFRPEWAAMAKPALFGTLLAIALLVPAGWVVGNRMARPIGQLAGTISEMGRSDPGALLSELRDERDPELRRIGGAVKQLLVEMEERKRSEEALRESEARFRAVFEHAVDAFFLLDPELKVIDVNGQACEALGYSREELVGMHPRQFDAKLDERSIELVRARVRAGETITFETLHRKSDGTVFPVEIRSRTFLRGGEQLYLALARDISERKRTEQTVRAKDQALQAVRAELARVSRVMTLGELTASIAHEVNQPLAAMVANAAAVKRWLAADPPQTEKARRALQSIADDGRRAGEVIKRVRALVQRRPAPMAPLGVNDAIADVIALAQQELRSNDVVLSRRLAEGLPSVLGDRIQLQQVLLNLVINAVEAMSAVTDRPRVLTITSGLHEPGAVLVEVRDTGPGLEHEHGEHLFEAFYTTKPEGLGIGLSISRSIIEAHGGRLSAAPNIPHGALFRFTLPVQGDASA
ncbi:nitrogen regulation protein NR(II) [Ramlibacter sp. WS9]|uniref:two-component system sensor histidine kinase NtrB n=1 Tax=Ramlibacter sp. WS9 TaxID=1882741 RepID=UPI001143946B|nr:PAS domain S-box protein [Ramlibacter sp. WS9]ROZ66231.1 sensor histidine kinase [Ramlibacter sp. WS9]